MQMQTAKDGETKVKNHSRIRKYHGQFARLIEGGGAGGVEW